MAPESTPVKGSNEAADTATGNELISCLRAEGEGGSAWPKTR